MVSLDNKNDRFKLQFLNLFAHPKAKAIEIHLNNQEHLDYLLNNDVNLEHFNYRSIHAPAFPYENSRYFKNLLKKVEIIVNRYNVFNVIIHPDQVKDWQVFNEFPSLPISLENMDLKKNQVDPLRIFRR